jgi:hypothetical protein
MRSLLNFDDKQGYLFEVKSLFNGKLGRIIILLSLGIGCTVWFQFLPYGPLSPVFNPFNTYEPFTLFDNYVPEGKFYISQRLNRNRLVVFGE